MQKRRKASKKKSHLTICCTLAFSRSRYYTQWYHPQKPNRRSEALEEPSPLIFSSTAHTDNAVPPTTQQRKHRYPRMGKKDKKGSSSSGSKDPVCSCEHPYNCDCGNRPERPSRGHKWDPETKTWGGKGHKPKGASLGAAVIGVKELQVTKRTAIIDGY